MQRWITTSTVCLGLLSPSLSALAQSRELREERASEDRGEDRYQRTDQTERRARSPVAGQSFEAAPAPAYQAPAYQAPAYQAPAAPVSAIRGQDRRNSYDFDRNAGGRDDRRNDDRQRSYDRSDDRQRNYDRNNDRRRDYVQGRDYRRHYSAPYFNPNYGRSNNYRSGYSYGNSYYYGYGNPFGYSYGYSPFGYGSYYGNRHGRLSGTDTVVLGVGLGVLGLALATQAGRSNDDRDGNRSWSTPDSIYRANPPTGYSEPPYDPALPAAALAFDASCQQTREYQTTIRVGGETVKAYGTACLQLDGTWRKGPPVLEPR